MDFANISTEAAQNFDAMAMANFDAMAAENFAGKNSLGQPATLRSSFDLSITNSSAEALIVELFNQNRSFSRQRNLAYITSGTILYKPLDTTLGQQAAGVGIIGFDGDGALVATGAVAWANALKVTCAQYPYRALLDASGCAPFRIFGIRMTTTTDAQIDNEIVHFNATFLGARAQNSVSPRTYFRPDQYQNKIVDIECDFRIDRERGLYMTINAGETVKMSFMVERATFHRKNLTT